jgi:hypothetical protein
MVNMSHRYKWVSPQQVIGWFLHFFLCCFIFYTNRRMGFFTDVLRCVWGEQRTMEISSYLICLSQLKGVWELDVPLVVCPLRWFFCLLEHGSFHFVPCVPPFLGALDFITYLLGIIFSPISHHLRGKPKKKCLHGMVWLDEQDKEDNNIANTPISFFSSFNKMKSSWLAILFLTWRNQLL